MVKTKQDSKKKIRVNLTLDADNLEKVRKKIHSYGGKLSSLFDLYLSDFVKSMDKEIVDKNLELNNKITELEDRLRKLENKK